MSRDSATAPPIGPSSSVSWAGPCPWPTPPWRGVQWQKSRDHAALFPLNLSQLKRSAVLLIVAALWVFLVPIVGYLVTATLATLAVVLFFEPKRDKAHVIRDVVVTLIFSVVIYQLFALLGVHFPKGLLL